MNTPVKIDLKRGECTQLAPFTQTLEEGKLYHYCTCGNSATQPFCDGSHVGTKFRPIKFKGQGKEVKLCGCRQSTNPNGPQYCDNTHQKIDW